MPELEKELRSAFAIVERTEVGLRARDGSSRVNVFFVPGIRGNVRVSVGLARRTVPPERAIDAANELVRSAGGTIRWADGR